MPTYKVKLANGKTLALRGDEPPTDADIEQAATSAGVRALLVSSGVKRESGSSPTSNSTPASIVAALGGLASASMAAAPAVVAAGRVVAPGVVPAVTGVAAAKHLYEGEPMKAAGDVALGTTTAGVAKTLLGKLTGLTASRAAARLRAASPYAAGLSAISALHSVNERQRESIMADPEIEETTKKAVERLLRQMAEREAR